MTTPFYLYQDIPTEGSFQLETEVQAGEPISGADGLSPRLSPFAIRFVPPDVLSGIIASGGQDDPYSRRELTVQGGELEATLESRGAVVYGKVNYFTQDGDGNNVPVEIDSYTPLDFVQNLTTSEGNGNNFGYLRNNGRVHQGVDIYVPQGSPVYAPFDVEVTGTWGNQVGDGDGAGIVLRSASDPEIRLRYLHLQTYSVTTGDIIPAGTQVGITIQRDFTRPGEGRSRSHLHLEAIVGEGARGNISPFAVFDASTTVNSTPAGQPAVSISRNVSQSSRRGIFAEAVSSQPGSSYRNPDSDVLRTIIPISPTELETYISEGERVTSRTPDRAAIIDRAYKADLARQLQIMSQAPPIIFMINPSSLSVSQPKMSQFQARARNQYIYEEFRGDIWSLSASITFGGFYTKEGPRRGAGNEPAASPFGLQMSSRRDSASYQQFMALLAMYQNNGSLVDRITGSKSKPLVGAIAIEWDGYEYIGKFSGFSYTESEEDPHKITIEIQFEATNRKSFDDASAPTPLVDLNTGIVKAGPEPSTGFWNAIGAQVTIKENGPVLGNPTAVATFTPNVLTRPAVGPDGFEVIDPVPNIAPFGRRR